jgi:hypothetical protein
MSNPPNPPNPSNPQPPARHENRIQVLWSDVQCEYLIDQRMSRNEEFWRLGKGGKVRFWREIAVKINNVFGTDFMGEQVKQKWKNLQDDYEVSIFYVNLFLDIYLPTVIL